MKKKYLLLSLIPLLAACTLQKPSFCFVNDPTKVHLTQNGDLYSKSFENISSYSYFERIAKAEDIERIIDSGNQCLAFLYSATCSSCSRYLPIVSELEYDSKVEIQFIDVTNGISELNSLATYYPNGNYASTLSYSSIQTPSLYLFKTPITVEQIDITDAVSATALENKIHEQANVTNISNFYSYNSFLTYARENQSIVYILDSSDSESNSFLDSQIITKAKYSFAKTAIIYWNKLSDVDKTNYKSLLSIENDHEIVFTYDENITISSSWSYISDIQNATNLVNSYYEDFSN